MCNIRLNKRNETKNTINDYQTSNLITSIIYLYLRNENG